MRLLSLLFAVFLTLPAAAQDRFSIPLPSDAFPNFVALGIGAAPDYLGSDDYFVGAAPAINLDLGPARFKMLGNWAMVDMLTDANWTLGPAAILRFGRNATNGEADTKRDGSKQRSTRDFHSILQLRLFAPQLEWQAACQLVKERLTRDQDAEIIE